MATEYEKLVIALETRFQDKGLKAASKGAAGLASDIGAAGDKADASAAKSEGAFAKIRQAISKTRSDAKEGAEFELRSDEGGLGKITQAIQGARADAAKGADFELRASGGVGSLSKTMQNVRSDASRGATFQVDTGSSESALSGINSQLKEIASTAAGVALGDVGGDFAGGMSQNFQDAAKSAGMLQAQLGISESKARELKGVGLDVYTSNWGDSVAETTDALARVNQGLSHLGAGRKELQSLTESTFILRDAFGIDTQESIEAARIMTQNYGISGKRAFDLITAGAQGGANSADDLTDSLREYSPYMSELGITAKEQMAMYSNAMKAGAWNTDKVGDAVKEFSIRAIDGSKLTSEGFQKAGLDADVMAAKISEGGPAAQKAFEETVRAILSMKNPREQEQAGVALFGTMWEDLGPKVFRSMLKGEEGLGKVEGATNRAGDAMSNNLSAKIAGASRQLQTLVSNNFGVGLGTIAEGAGQAGMAVGGIGFAASAAGPKLWTMGAAGWAAVAPWLAAAAPFALAAGAIAGVGTAAIVAYRHSETFRKGMDWLGESTIGTSNMATISEEGFAGLGKVLNDGHGASAAWSGGLTGLKKKLTDNKGASAAWAEGLPSLKAAITDTSGASGGFRKVLSGIKNRLTDNAGASQAWAEGLPGLKTALTDTQGASGGFRSTLAGIKQRLTDNQGASSAWSGGLEGLKTKLTDTQGASGGLRRGLSGLKDRFTDSQGASGGLKTALEGLRAKASETSTGFTSLKSRSLARLTEMKNQGLARASEMGSGLLARWTNQAKNAGQKYTNIRNTIGSRLAEGKNRAIARTAETGSNLISRWGNQAKNAGEKYSSIRNSIGNRLREGKDRAISRTAEMGSGLISRWTNQRKQSGEKFTGIRNMIGNRMRESKTRATDRMRELGSNMISSANNIRRKVGDAFGKLGNRMPKTMREARDGLKSVWNTILSGISKVLGAVGMKDLSKKVEGAKWEKGGIAGSAQPGRRFATGGIAGISAFADGGTGGMGTSAKNPRIHLWNEQQGGEAYIAEKRPAKEQLPYLQTAADWHGYAVVPANPAKHKIKHSDYTSHFAEGGLSPGGSTSSPVPVVPFNFGGAQSMWEAVKRKFGVEGFNNHWSYLPAASAAKSIDWMVTTPGNRATGSQKELGDRIAAFTAPPSAQNTIWYGRANFGAGWQGYSTGPGVGNANTLGHYDHVHAEAHGGSFRGGQGSFMGGDSGPSLQERIFEKAWDSTIGRGFKKAQETIDGAFVLRKGAAKVVGDINEGVKEFLLKKIREKFGGGSGEWNGSMNTREWAEKGLALGNAWKPITQSMISDTMQQIQIESGGKANAMNDWDSNAAKGTPSGGAVQVIEPTWESIRHKYGSDLGSWKDNWMNPIKSVAAGSRSMKSQWGSWVWPTAGGYDLGGIIPGPDGKEVLIQAHAGERVLSRDVVKSFDRLARSVQVWSAKQSGSVRQSASVVQTSSSEEHGEKQVAELRQQTKILQRQQGVLVRAVVAGVERAPRSAGFQRNLDDLMAAALEGS